MTDSGVDDRWSGQIDGIVAEVFHTMLQQDCGAVDLAEPVKINITAKVILSGAIEAQCVIEFPPATATKLTNAFMGSEGDWQESEVNDVLGELCNMIAGGWKTQLEVPSSASHLSLPSIARGEDLHTLDVGKKELRRAYALDGTVFMVGLTIL